MRNQFKYRFSIRHLYDATVRGIRAFPTVIFNRIKKRVSPDLIERLMLVTTEVNGCDLCSYAHTRIALKEGFSKEEIESLLSGSSAYVHENDATAIFFAQHYAESKGRPEKDAYNRLAEIYGKREAYAMISAIQVMMMANIQGVFFSALLSRLKKNPYQDSSLIFEIVMLLLEIILFPITLVDAFFRFLFRIPNVRFEKTPNNN